MVRLSTVLGFALATASVLIPGVLSQDVPACATTCAQQAATASGCSLSDTNCVCTNPAFATAAGQCLTTACDAADIQAATTFFESLCSDATDPGTSTASATGASSASDTSTPTDTSSIPDDTSSIVPTSTASTNTPLTTSTTSATSPGTTTSPTSTRSPASVVSSTTSTSSTSKPSNHAMHNQPAGVFGAGLALALALFA